MQAVKLDLPPADRTLRYTRSITFVAVDLSGAAFELQIRRTPDAPGSPIIRLLTVTTDIEGIRVIYAGTTTVAAHVAAARLDSSIYGTMNPATSANYKTTDNLLLSQIGIHIHEDTMDVLPAAEQVGDDLRLAYDMLVAVAGTTWWEKYLYGAFIVRGTVTQ